MNTVIDLKNHKNTPTKQFLNRLEIEVLEVDKEHYNYLEHTRKVASPAEYYSIGLLTDEEIGSLTSDQREKFSTTMEMLCFGDPTKTGFHAKEVHALVKEKLGFDPRYWDGLWRVGSLMLAGWEPTEMDIPYIMEQSGRIEDLWIRPNNEGKTLSVREAIDYSKRKWVYNRRMMKWVLKE